MKNVAVDQGSFDILTTLDDLEKNHERIVLYRNGQPIAHLAPYGRKRKSRLTPHPVMGKITIKYDPTEAMDQTEWPEDA